MQIHVLHIGYLPRVKGYFFMFTDLTLMLKGILAKIELSNKHSLLVHLEGGCISGLLIIQCKLDCVHLFEDYNNNGTPCLKNVHCWNCLSHFSLHFAA